MQVQLYSGYGMEYRGKDPLWKAALGGRIRLLMHKDISDAVAAVQEAAAQEAELREAQKQAALQRAALQDKENARQQGEVEQAAEVDRGAHEADSQQAEGVRSGSAA